MRFFSNDRMYNIGIKSNPMCTMCSTEHDSDVHMLLGCEIVSYARY